MRPLSYCRGAHVRMRPVFVQYAAFHTFLRKIFVQVDEKKFPKTP